MTNDLIRTGLPTLDTLLGGGLHPGRLTVVAGQSQSGMTTLLDTIACAAAFRDGVPTVLADLETATHHRMLRLSSALSGVPLVAMQRGTLTAEQAATIRTADQAGAPFWFADDTATIAGLRRALDADGLAARLLLVDGTRLLGDGGLPRIMMGLDELAATSGVAVVATHPIRWYPRLPWDNLPESALWAAHNLVTLRRPGLHSGTPTGEVEVTVAKLRDGDSGSFTAVADFEHARIAEPAPDRVAS